ncbi:hypothetical protein ACH5RR_032472 [Cinchona calisaya]|uniref:Uncharacterized protein n=1 Tax=Cinchona calisaya TaxID=153742 RepID=A0ABD2YLP0_9GENT
MKVKVATQRKRGGKGKESERENTRVKVTRMHVLAMVDTGATHSFVTGREIDWLKLGAGEARVLYQGCKFRSTPVLGIASVELTFDPWSGKCKLMAVPLHDFDLILGKEFMATYKIFSIPHLDGVIIANER